MYIFMDKQVLTVTPAEKTFNFPSNSIVRYITNRSNTGIVLNINGKTYDINVGMNEIEVSVGIDTKIKYDQNPTLSVDFEFIYFFPL